MMDAHVFLQQFYTPSTGNSSSASKENKEKHDIVVELRDKLPWLTASQIMDYLADEETCPKKTPKETEDSTHPPPARVDPDVAMGEDAAIALAAVVERVEAEDEEVDYADFFPKVLGGVWTDLHMGIPFDRLACKARSHTKKWRKMFKIQEAYTFSVGLYGEHDAHMLVKAWIHKLTYLFELWLGRGEPAAQYSEEDHAEFAHTESYMDWACALELESDSFTAVLKLRHFRPVIE
jgi:hypothetical protein